MRGNSYLAMGGVSMGIAGSIVGQSFFEDYLNMWVETIDWSELITLASMLRIPVYMHNVPEDQIFRPSIWTAFGAMEPQGADFRACANFGLLYG